MTIQRVTLRHVFILLSAVAFSLGKDNPSHQTRPNVPVRNCCPHRSLAMLRGWWTQCWPRRFSPWRKLAVSRDLHWSHDWLIVVHGIYIVSQYMYHISLANCLRFFAIIFILILLLILILLFLHILHLLFFLLFIFLLFIITILILIHIAI